MVQVRTAAPTDAADVERVRVRTWQAAYAGIVPDDVLAALDDQLEERAGRIRDRWSAPGPRRFTTLVAVDPVVCGFVTYGPYRIEDGPDGRLEAAAGEVLAVYVEPRRQGRGAGRALLDAAVAALGNAGVSEVRLWVLEENAPSRRFYERYGFVADGARQHFRVRQSDGTPVDLPEVRYTLALR